MDRIWQWAWDRYGARYSWAMYAIGCLLALQICLMFVIFILVFEDSDRYVVAIALAVVTVLVQSYVMVRPGRGPMREVELWAAGERADPARVLGATYDWARGAVVRALASAPLCAALLGMVVGGLAGATWSRLVQYALLGALSSVGSQLVAVHAYFEASLRPPRLAIAADTGLGDSLPRTRPSFAAWSTVSMLGVAFTFSVGAALLATVIGHVAEAPALSVAIGAALTLGFAVPTTVGAVFSPSLRPIRDLAAGTERVAAGDYSRRLPVVQDDDLGALAASFNRMQAGLAERQRLQAAFGTYVDPTLAARLLEQGDEVFTGERREVTVLFVDIRDFTPFAEANTAEDTVARLNALFEIVVPAVVEAGGHVNKYLGDGALAVFGAPNDLAGHADAAVAAAVLIRDLVTERFNGELRIGIGINSGPVIAGTIGSAGKLEFTLIGDTVNVAARVEQLTKTTGDTILLTEQTLHSLADQATGLIDRGAHPLKCKAAATRVYGLDTESVSPAASPRPGTPTPGSAGC